MTLEAKKGSDINCDTIIGQICYKTQILESCSQCFVKHSFQELDGHSNKLFVIQIDFPLDGVRVPNPTIKSERDKVFES